MIPFGFQQENALVLLGKQQVVWSVGISDLGSVQADVEFEVVRVRFTDGFNDGMVHACRHCGGERLQKNGRTQRGVQRALCRDCQRTFTLSPQGPCLSVDVPG